MLRKAKLKLLALALALLVLTPGCIGSFALSHDVWSRNMKIDNKTGRECLFLALLVVPVYEIAVIADMLVFNTVELFSDENIWASPEGETSSSRMDMEP